MPASSRCSGAGLAPQGMESTVHPAPQPSPYPPAWRTIHGCRFATPPRCRVGSLHTSGDELMTAVTGAPLQPQVFLEYLTAKYSELYQL